MRGVTWVGAVTFTVVGLCLTGCGGDGEAGDTESDGTETAAENSLTGSVGPGYYIQMAETQVSPGTYTFTVDDMAADHNFHFTGPGVDVTTGVGEEGKKVFTVDLQAGTYRFVCDPHSASMKGTLTVE
jgi:plastocyanin